MKRNWDIIRNILLAIEQHTGTDDYVKQLPGFDETDYWRHLALMRDGGLVDKLSCRLTWDGHELVDAIRNETTWNRIKTTAREKGIELTLSYTGQFAHDPKVKEFLEFMQTNDSRDDVMDTVYTGTLKSYRRQVELETESDTGY